MLRLCVPTSRRLLKLLHRSAEHGGVLVPLNTRLGAMEIHHMLEHSGARMLFVDAELESLFAEPPPGVEIVRVDDDGQSTDPYQQLLAEGDPEGVPSLLLDEEQPISINYTSGTTGRPKGVVYTFRGAYLNSLGQVVEAELGHHPVYLWTLPMFHCNGWCFPWAVTAASGTHVCLRQVDPGLIWRLFEERGSVTAQRRPTVQTALVPIRRGSGSRDRSPPGRGRRPRRRCGALEEFNIRSVHVYGLTETYGPNTLCVWHDGWSELPAEERARLLSRQGQWYTTADAIRVVDKEMQDVPQDGDRSAKS